MRPRTSFPLVTTRAPIFFARSQSAARLMLASGANGVYTIILKDALDNLLWSLDGVTGMPGLNIYSPTIRGGNQAGDNIDIESTSHAIKEKLIFWIMSSTLTVITPPGMKM